jgi:asparagine synthase (glutamine-hydrolysing)
VCAAATEARLASPGPVAAELSGGVDSSSVVGLVEYLRRAGRHNKPLVAYSMVFPGRCDETAYSRAVARQLGVVTREVHPQPAGAELYEPQVQRYLDLHDYPNMMMHRAHFLAAKEEGCRVFLGGQGGDDWFSGNLYSFADSLRHLRLDHLMTDVHIYARAAGWRASLPALWHSGVKPLAPDYLRRAARRAKGKTRLPAWLEPTFCNDIGLADRTRTRARAQAQMDVSLASGMVASYLDDGWHAHASEFRGRAIASMGQEYRDPFDDRRVVEMALAFPPDQRRRGDVTKYVLRAAMAGLIPESVRTRTDKGDFSHTFYEDLRLQGGSQLFTGMVLEELGWVDGSKVRAMYDQLDHYYRHGGISPEHLYPPWMILAVERWLRAVI